MLCFYEYKKFKKNYKFYTLGLLYTKKFEADELRNI